MKKSHLTGICLFPEHMVGLFVVQSIKPKNSGVRVLGQGGVKVQF